MSFLLSPLTQSTILPLCIECLFLFLFYLKRSNCEASHVVPEDQRALRPSGGDDGGLQVSGVTVASVRTVCTQIPTLWTAAVGEKT